MIPADDFRLNGDGTAWWVVDNVNGTDQPHADLMVLDRPCDTCDGDEHSRTFWLDHCPDCADGRHTFDINVNTGLHQAWERSGRWYAHDCDKHCSRRVSVVPGVILPIHDGCPWYKPADHICEAWGDHRGTSRFYWHKSGTGETETMVDLPPGARPGGWAVKLRVVV